MERVNEAPAADMRPMTPEQLEAFYSAEYPVLVKVVVLLGAAIEEAEDAAQRAMADFIRRAQAARLPAHPAAWVRKAAIRFFIKERERDRERLPREIRGGHLVAGTYDDDRLTSMEDEQDVEIILKCLTPTQQQVIKLVMKGLSTRDVGEELGKSNETIRQHLKKGRDRLRAHPQVAPLAPRQGQPPGQPAVRPAVTAPAPGKDEAQ